MPRPAVDQPKFSLAPVAGRKNLSVQWWENGRCKRVSARTADEKKARRFLADFIAGRSAPKAPETQNPSIGEIIDGYAEHVKKRGVADTSDYVCAKLKRLLGDTSIDALTKERINWYFNTRRAEGRNAGGGKRVPIADGTLRREGVILRAAIRWAIGERWISRDQEPKIELPKAPKPKARWLTHDEADRLIAAAITPHVRAFIILGIYTAARKTAILELKWEDVDFRHGKIDLGTGVGNKHRATVPMNSALRDALHEIAVMRTSDFVIEHASDGIKNVRTGFKASVRRAKLKAVTPHTLRHTAATWMVQAGLKYEMVGRYLGCSAEMVERVYGHHSPDWLREASDALNAWKPQPAA